jgi:branched-chain amino acid transport system substrate-binding protein
MKKTNSGMTRRTLLKGGLAAVGLGVVGFPTFLRAAPKEVKVGLLAPLTGVSANWGQRTYYGFQYAAQLINETGGIKSMDGAKLKTVVVDTESKPEVAGIQAEKLIAQKDILIISGSNQSAASMVATQVAERSRVCFVTGTDGAPQITLRGFKYTYRCPPTMNEYGRDLIYFCRDIGKATGKMVKTMAILVENSIFGVSGGDAAAKYAKEVGFEIVDYSSYDAVTTRDFTGYISKYKSAGVDLLLCHSRPQDSVMITRTMKELDFNPLGYGGMLGSHNNYEFAETLGKDSNYVIGSNNFTDAAKLPGVELGKLIERGKKEFKILPDSTMIGGFSVFSVLKAALEKNPTYDREEAKQAVDKVSVEVGENNNLQIDGIRWAPNHDNALVKAFIIQWKNGAMNVVAPEAYAIGKPVWPRPTWAEIDKM